MHCSPMSPHFLQPPHGSQYSSRLQLSPLSPDFELEFGTSVGHHYNKSRLLPVLIFLPLFTHALSSPNY